MHLDHLAINMATKIVLIVSIFFTLLYLVSSEVQRKSDRSEFKRSLSKNCDDTYSLTCLKLDVVSWVDKLSENKDISVLPGVSIVRENNSATVNNGEMVTEVAREFPDDPNARLDAFLTKKVSRFLNNYSIKLSPWKAIPGESVGTGRGKGGGGGGGGGGGKKGGDGGMGMFLGMAAMMKAMMMSLALGGVAALAGKALMVALIALVLSAVAGLKGLSHGGGGHSTYEVISKPVYTSSHSHSTAHEGWDGGYGGGHGRSLVDAPLPLALQPDYKLP